MQETQTAKQIVIKPIAGMTQFTEALSVTDAEFRVVSGVYPKEQGIQARMYGKVPSFLFGSSVLSLADFLGYRIVQTSNSGLFLEQNGGTFATLQNAAATQNKNKDSCAISPSVQLAVRANGEEQTKVIDTNGNIFAAGITQPTVAPTLSLVGPASTFIGGLWYGYSYCFAATTAYPFVERTTSINGEICPRGNPAPSNTTEPSAGQSVTFQIPPPTVRADIDKVWIFRTTGYSTVTECQNACNAGLLFFKSEQPITGSTISYVDSSIIDGVDQIEEDNFFAAAFKSVIFYDPYWLGFGADVLKAQATWTSGVSGTCLITLASDKWWDGRNNEPIRFTGITSNGFDGKGTFHFKYASATTGTIVAENQPNGSPVSLPAMPGGTNYITISPATCTVYRSKASDPFSWGWTRIIGSESEALSWSMNIGGGNGTAIAVVPNESILKVDTEFPTKCYAYNLQMIDNFDQFRQTRKVVSEIFSVTCQSGQFVAQTSDGNSVLWGMDYKNFAIVQSNGVTQQVVPAPLQNTLRSLTTAHADQIMCHGIYDPLTQCNCIWLTLANSPSRVHYLIYQHAPTGFWGVVEELDCLCSVRIQDSITNQSKIMVGTESGLYGQAFVPGVYQNWITTAPLTGVVSSGSASSLTSSTSAFSFATLGMIGTWLLLTDSNDQNEQWARISAATLTTITFDRVWYNQQRFATLQINAAATNKFYIGLIECRLKKYFDLKIPNIDKQFLEIVLSQEGVSQASQSSPTFVRIFREWSTTIAAQFQPYADEYADNSLSSTYIDKQNIPSEMMKSFALELVNREYTQWILRNIVLKYGLAP